MKIVAKKKLWKYLFWLGPFFLVAGLTSGLVASRWGPISLGFLITGLVIIGLWVILQSQESKWWGRRSTQAGTNALVATMAVLVILGLINFLGTRYHYRADFTETQLFTLAPQSRELVNNLAQPVKVWIFDKTQNPQDRDLLENYRRQNSKFQFEYVDPDARPGLARQFGYKDNGEIYLEYQDKRQLVQVVNERDRLSEVRLTNRLQQITTANSAKVYFLQGHGEHQITAAPDAMSQAVQELTDKNFITAPLNLAEQPKVPDDATAVVVAGPERGLFDSEVKALQDYLNRGGNLMLMIDLGTEPKLDNLLKDWGVRLDNRLAVDLSKRNAEIGPAISIVTEYGQHPITKDFANGISFYQLARPIEVTPVPGIESTPLLRTKPYPDSWAESDLKSEKLEFNADKDLKGPLTLGVALKKKISAASTTQAQPSPTPSPLPSPTTQGQVTPSPSPSPAALPSPTTASQASPSPIISPSPANSAPPTDKQPEQTATESRLVVFGNSEFVKDGLFQQQLNGDVFLNSVTWLSQQEDKQPLSIRPKEAKNRRLNINAVQAGVLALSSLLLLPLLGLVGAAVIWWRRR
ncbi:Gldg family protein [Tolypothrix sp. FACHB-123]|uniref:GldG family protein n=1 Tax=Tolypothrix sp. FACHB-123 TaxID=2692868 RepID=UPI001685E55A|nr:Gldg family protein [Tolypothrix sp. FACHB-123]MBD2353892.1 Gldg family protein [Tolypothrix sp. FACHB-123]